MTREEAVNRLCDIYSGEFDVRLCEEHRKPLAAQMDFYAESSKYVLSKKAKLWEANCQEHLFVLTETEEPPFDQEGLCCSSRWRWPLACSIASMTICC